MKIELNHIYNGDCLALFKEMRDNSVDLIVTDPPYRITSRGGTGTMSGFMNETRSKNGKIFTHNDCDIANYLPELFRVLKDGTHCYIMCNYLYAIFFDLTVLYKQSDIIINFIKKVC